MPIRADQVTKTKNGFTLVEMAIVIVIVALISGAVLVGIELIKSAELRSVIAQRENWTAAVNTFRLKYDALPGDMKNAAQLWGQLTGDCYTAVATGTETCNGDGDGAIDYDSANDSPHEPFRMWQHLASANLVPMKYTGASTNSGCAVNACYQAGVNVPAGPVNNSIWVVMRIPVSAIWTPQAGRHAIILGNAAEKQASSPSSWLGRWHNPVLSPLDQFSIDSKIDDGMPYLGTVSDFNFVSYTDACTDSETPSSARYSIAVSTKSCVLITKAGF